MQGASISRWTMTYFATSLVFLLIGQALLVVGFGYPVLQVEAPETLVIVHLLAIGWLGLLFCGALLQFVPVLVARPLHAPSLAVHALILLIAGLLLLCLGFLHLAGRIEVSAFLLPMGAMLLTIGFGFIIYIIGGTLVAGTPLALPARFVALGLLALGGTAGLGFLFSLQLSGLTGSTPLANFLPDGLSIHAYLGLVGWMSVSAFGVSYRLLAMFLLAPERERRTSQFAFYLLSASTTITMSLVLVLRLGGTIHGLIYASLALAAVAALLFSTDVVAMYRQRKRKALELNTLITAVAVGALLVSVLAFILLTTFGELERQLAPLVYLVCFGWLTTLGLGQLYKIAAFMTWLEHYGPVLGRQAVPRVQDLVNERRASRWFYLYICAVAAAVLTLLLGSMALFRTIALLQTVAVGMLALEIARTRRLRYVSLSSGSAVTMPRPNLFLPHPLERK